MEASSVAEERRQRARAPRWRLWALVPIVLLVAVVSLFAARGGSLLDLVGEIHPRGRVRRAPRRVLAGRDLDPRDEPAARGPHHRHGDGRRRDRPLHRRRADDPGPAAARPRSSFPTRGSRTSRSRSGSRARPASRRPRRSPPPSRPPAEPEGFLGYAIIGALVGIVPVALGLLWLLRFAARGRVARGVHGPDRRAPHVPGRRGAPRPWSSRPRRLAPSGAPGSSSWRGCELPGADVPLAAARQEGGRAGRARSAARPGAARGHRHRRPQPRGGARRRNVVRSGRADAGHVPHRRLHAPQRHGGARHRGARRRGGAGRDRPPGRARPHRRRADDPRRLDRRLRDKRRAWPWSSSRSLPGRRCRSSSRWSATWRGAHREASTSGYAVGGFLAGLALMYATGLLVG